MAYYLVSATPRLDRLGELRARLAAGDFVDMQPFGRALSASLRSARRASGGVTVWEEEDYCRPPLAQERAAVLDHYFLDIEVEPVSLGDGWRRIRDLPALFPDLADASIDHTGGPDADSDTPIVE